MQFNIDTKCRSSSLVDQFSRIRNKGIVLLSCFKNLKLFLVTYHTDIIIVFII